MVGKHYTSPLTERGLMPRKQKKCDSVTSPSDAFDDIEGQDQMIGGIGPPCSQCALSLVFLAPCECFVANETSYLLLFISTPSTEVMSVVTVTPGKTINIGRNPSMGRRRKVCCLCLLFPSRCDRYLQLALRCLRLRLLENGIQLRRCLVISTLFLDLSKRSHLSLYHLGPSACRS